jgi:5'-3' exonuclease
MNVHLIDGTYELFRHHYALPSSRNADGQEVAATRGVCGSVLGMIEAGATHVAVATDHVIESFRNDLWPGYKDASGIEPDLLSQFGVLEDALEAMGVTVWRMVEHEADDGLASGAALASGDDRVERVFICTPDKDLAQCVERERVVQFDRRQRAIIEEKDVVAKFGVPPSSIPDYLALMGDSADGYPGLKGWGRKSAAQVLARYGHLEEIPGDAGNWDVEVRGATRLAQTLREQRELALLFRRIATVVRDAPVSATVDDLRWRGPQPTFGAIANRIGAPMLARRGGELARSR